MISGLSPSVNSFAPIANIPSTRTNVPIISLIKLEKGFLIAGLVEKTTNFSSLSVQFPPNAVNN